MTPTIPASVWNDISREIGKLANTFVGQWLGLADDPYVPGMLNLTLNNFSSPFNGQNTSDPEVIQFQEPGGQGLIEITFIWHLRDGLPVTSDGRSVGLATRALVGIAPVAASKLWHTIRHPTNWTPFGDVAAQVGGLSPFADISCASVSGEMHISGSSFDGNLWHAIRRQDGHWTAFGNVKNVVGDPGHVVKVSVAGTGSDLHMCVVTTDGHLWHSLAQFQTGRWSPFADVEGQTGDRGTFVDVNCAVVNSELHVSGITNDGRLWHSIRRSDGRWTPFGDVKGQAGDRGRAMAVASDGTGSELNLCIVTSDGHLWHSIRRADGRWTPFGDVEGQSGDRGLFVEVDCASLDSGLHVGGVTTDGHLWHTIGQRTGWTAFGDVEGQTGDRGTVTAVTCAGVAGELHLCALAAS